MDRGCGGQALLPRTGAHSAGGTMLRIFQAQVLSASSETQSWQSHDSIF